MQSTWRSRQTATCFYMRVIGAIKKPDPAIHGKYNSRTSSSHHAVPNHPHGSTKHNGYRWAHFEPHAANITRRGHHNPPRLRRETGSLLVVDVDVANLPQPVHGSVDQPYSSGVDTPDHGLYEPPVPDGSPDPHRSVDEHDSRPEDANVAHQGPERGILPPA